MIPLFGLALLGLMQDDAGKPVEDTAPVDAPQPELAPGALFERILALDRGGDEEQAFELVGRELQRGEVWSEDVRARLHFARGVLARDMPPPPAPPDGAEADEEPDEAGPVASFSAARALAGSGRLREHASYNLGTYELELAEELRAQIPEVAQAGAAPGASGAPGMQALPGGQPGPPPPGGDPLPRARAAYLAARASLIECLRLEQTDPDTRANLQLILRRLRELDEIEKQREEQQQDQEQQQQDDQEGEPDENSEEQEESEDQEQSDSENQEQDPEQEGEPQQEEEREPQDPEQKPDPEPDQISEEEQQEVEAVPPPEGEPQEAQGQEPSERHLTREEVMRLLDRLEELEEEGRQLEAAIQKARRIPVKRDW